MLQGNLNITPAPSPPQARIMPPLHHLRTIRAMSTPHSVRTSTHPRSTDLHKATITALTHPTAHLLKATFRPQNERLRFLPGQWVDLHLPGLEQPGGFTITSSPLSDSQTFSLSVQRAPMNPAAAWLWRSHKEVLGNEVEVRVGGAFVFPPSGLGRDEVGKVVFLAGGVGINPFLSMMAWKEMVGGEWSDLEMEVLWGAKRGEFGYLDEVERWQKKEIAEVRLFVTDGTLEERFPDGISINRGRMRESHIRMAVGEDKKDSDSLDRKVVVYICGPKGFTESCQDVLKKAGIEDRRVICEKWW